MRTNKFTLTAATSTLLISGLLLAGCTAVAAETATDTAVTSTVSSLEAGLAAAEVLEQNANATTVNDDEWSMTGAVTITLAGSTASADGDGVTIDGSTVTVTAAGTYVLSGELDGQVVIAAGDEDVVALVLDGAAITSSTTAAISVETADDVVVSLTGDSTLVSTGDDDDYL